jgi:hypothetical protein
MTEGNGIMNALIQIARDSSPYLAVELLLPGGTVIALLLWLFRHRRRIADLAIHHGLAAISGLKALAGPFRSARYAGRAGEARLG